MIYKKITIALLISVLLSGCAYFQKKPRAFTYVPWKKREAEHRKITAWKMAGVFSITYKKKRDVASFDWQQKPDGYTINISGPIGIGSARVVGDSEGVKFWRTSEEVFAANTPEQLMQEQLGWQLPISDIRYWILGMPAPKRVDYKYLDRYGHLNFFKQNGWQVRYSEFRCEVKKGVDLPQLIELQNKDVAIKIKIKKQSVY